MKWRRSLYYLGCFTLMFHFLYEGLYKWLDLAYFKMWISGMPELGYLAGVLAYLIPLIQLIIGLFFIYPRLHLFAFYAALVFELINNGYLIWALLYGIVFLHPYHTYWKFPTWQEVIYFNSALSILSFFSILQLEQRLNPEYNSKKLRNKPASNC